MSTTVSRAPNRNRQFWIDHIKQWKRSGLSKAAYCQLHSINAGSFYNWSRPARDEVEPVSAAAQPSKPDAQSKHSLTFIPVAKRLPITEPKRVAYRYNVSLPLSSYRLI